MPWKEMEVREQRVEFVVRASRGVEPLSRLCVGATVPNPVSRHECRSGGEGSRSRWLGRCWARSIPPGWRPARTPSTPWPTNRFRCYWVSI